MEKVFSFLGHRIECPRAYGAYHLISFAVMLAVCIVLCILFRSGSDRFVRGVLLSYGLAAIALEIYKLVMLSLSFEDGKPVWSFAWYAFPFQFCSTPMYVATAAGLMRESRLRKLLISYLATFGVVGGLSVMLIPRNVLSPIAGISFQTMFCHAGMVVVGVYLLCCGAVRLKSTTIFGAAIVFISLAVIAMFINIISYQTGVYRDMQMFFISPYSKTDMPIIADFRSRMPYYLFLPSYFIVFTFLAYTVLSVAMAINQFSARLRRIMLRLRRNRTC